jgi:Short C-terminal domain
MPGLLRGMARTAVVAGTATAVSNRVSRRQAERWSAQEAPAYPPQGYAEPPPPAPAAAAAGGEDRVQQLKDLAALKEQGVLTDQEFAAEKARILGG